MTAIHHYTGLTDAQVLESRAKYGANVLTPPEEDSLWDQILEVCKHPIAITMACLIVGTVILAAILAGSMGAMIWVMPGIVAIATLLILIVGFFGGFGDPLFKILITAFVLSMARNIAVTMRIPVAMFSLEMSNIQLVNRLIVNVCGIEGSKIRSGQLAKHEWSQLDLNINQLRGAPLYIDDTPSLSVFELRTKARRLVRDFGVQMIIIDYLQLMNASGMSYGSRQEEVSTISRSLKGLAKELNIPIIALSQLNRSVEQRTSSNPDSPDSKRPQLSDLRESGAIEQDADMVCFIHRPEYYKIYKDQHGNDTKGIAEIIIAKHRNGAVGDVRLRFRSEYARFLNLDDDMPPMPTDDGTIKPTPSKLNLGGGDDSFDGLDISAFPGNNAGPAPF